MTLPYDIARCAGKNAPLCQRCRSREPGNPTCQSIILPALTIDGCGNFIGHAFLDTKITASGLMDDVIKKEEKTH
jgi:hypothetical protein